MPAFVGTSPREAGFGPLTGRGGGAGGLGLTLRGGGAAEDGLGRDGEELLVERSIDAFFCGELGTVGGTRESRIEIPVAAGCVAAPESAAVILERQYGSSEEAAPQILCWCRRPASAQERTHSGTLPKKLTLEEAKPASPSLFRLLR